MREIKFRAWDGGEMMYEGWNRDFFVTKEIIFRFERVMQYTGLKDKNGVEIYEGDIVIAEELGIDEEFRKTEEVWSSRKCEVFWDNNSSGWYLRSNDFPESCEPICHLDRFEVIGNIYENQDLLNKDQNPERSVATDDDSSKTDD